MTDEGDPAIEQVDDLAVAAISLLAKTAIESDYPGTLKGVYDHPRTLFEIPESELPALVVYCREQRDLHGTSGRALEQLEVVFEYALPSSSVHDERAPRWPTLRAVWRAIVEAMRAGTHGELPVPITPDADPADTLFDVTSLGVHTDSGAVRFQLNKGGREIDDGFARFPFFRGSLTFDHYPGDLIDPVDPSASQLYKFLSVHATWRRPGATVNTPGQPGFSTGEGPVVTNLPGHPDGLPEPGP